MGSKKLTFSYLAKTPLYQTPYSNFTISFFKIFYYFIYIYIYIFFHNSQNTIFSHFSLPSLALSLYSCYSPLIFFLPSPSPLFPPVAYSPPSLFLLVPIFFCFPIGENPLPASGARREPTPIGSRWFPRI